MCSESRRAPRTAYLLMCLSLISTASVAQDQGVAAVRADGEWTLGYDSNVANTRHNGPLREDVFARVAVDGVGAVGLNAVSALQVRFGAELQRYADYSDLSSARGRVQLRYLLRPGRGYFVPTVSLSGSAAAVEFASDLRDSREYRVDLSLSQPLTTRLLARFDLGGEWRRGSRGQVFDTTAGLYGVSLDWEPASGCVVYGGYQYRDGDFMAVGPAPPQAVLDAARAVAEDDVFTGDLVLRQKGSAQIGHLGLNYGLTRKLALDVQAQYADGASDFVHYRRWQTLASVLWRY